MRIFDLFVLLSLLKSTYFLLSILFILLCETIGVWFVDTQLNIPLDRLYFTVFKGDEDAPKDIESYSSWLSHGVSEDHIFFLFHGF